MGKSDLQGSDLLFEGLINQQGNNYIYLLEYTIFGIDVKKITIYALMDDNTLWETAQINELKTLRP